MWKKGITLNASALRLALWVKGVKKPVAADLPEQESLQVRTETAGGSFPEVGVLKVLLDTLPFDELQRLVGKLLYRRLHGLRNYRKRDKLSIH